MAAVSGDRMDDLEDGEISGSDSDSAMGVAGDERAQKPTVTAFSGHAFQSREPPRQTAPPVAAGYRSAAAGADSSDSGSDSEEEAAVWKRKRQRCSDAPQAPPPSARRAPPLSAAQAPGRKVNNIWGSVVQEQSQEAVAAELGILGMEGEVSMSSRQCETYNYVLARKLMEKEREQEAAGAAAMLDSQLDDYMQRRGGENGGGEHKRKRPTKERLGPRAEMDFEGRYEITEDDPDDRVKGAQEGPDGAGGAHHREEEGHRAAGRDSDRGAERRDSHGGWQQETDTRRRVPEPAEEHAQHHREAGQGNLLRREPEGLFQQEGGEEEEEARAVQEDEAGHQRAGPAGARRRLPRDLRQRHQRGAGVPGGRGGARPAPAAARLRPRHRGRRRGLQLQRPGGLLRPGHAHP